MQFLLLFSLTSFLSFFQFDGWRGDIQQPQVQQEALCESVQLSVKVFLEGPYVYDAGTMTGKMNASLNAVLPTGQPYSTAPYSFTYIRNGATLMGGGLESATTTVLNANTGTGNAIVDWVWVELWSNATPSVLVETRAALLQADGDVVDASNGTGPVMIPSNTLVVCAGRYYIGIRHRNHLGVKGTTLLELGATVPTVVADFTSAAYPIAGAVDGRAAITLTGNVAGKAMSSGDTNNDNNISSPDRDNTWNGRNLTGYQKDDCSMNGTVDSPDRDKTWNNRNKTNL